MLTEKRAFVWFVVVVLMFGVVGLAGSVEVYRIFGRKSEEKKSPETSTRKVPPDKVYYNKKTYPCYPKALDFRPDIPSPHTTLDGVEIITALMKDRKYSLIPVTVENAKPLNYEERRWGKGRQLEVDCGCVLNFLRFAQTNKNSAWLLYFLFASRLDNTYNPFQLTGSHVGYKMLTRRRKCQFGSDKCLGI